MRNIRDRVDITPRCAKCGKPMEAPTLLSTGVVDFGEHAECWAAPIVSGGQGRAPANTVDDGMGIVLTVLIAAAAVVVVVGLVGGWAFLFSK